MANQMYERIGGNKIRVWEVTQEFRRDTLEGDVFELEQLLALPSGAKQQLIDKAPSLLGSEPDQSKSAVENFDDLNSKKKDQLSDIIDYWGMDTAMPSGIDEIQATWIQLDTLAQGSGALVQDFCGEEVGNEATRAIDGAIGGHWEHDFDHQHSITVDLTYPKTVDGVRLWIPNTNSQFQISNATVRASFGLNGIDNASAVIATGVAFTGDGSYAEFLFPEGKKRVRYIRLENMDSAHAQNQFRIREIEIHVLTKFFDLEGN